jgi:hypothetical protein
VPKGSSMRSGRLAGSATTHRLEHLLVGLLKIGVAGRSQYLVIFVSSYIGLDRSRRSAQDEVLAPVLHDRASDEFRFLVGSCRLHESSHLSSSLSPDLDPHFIYRVSPIRRSECCASL